MIPENRLSTTNLPAQYLYPDVLIPTKLVDYELGGVALNDASEGLRVKTWTGTTDGKNVYLEADGVPKTKVFGVTGTISEISIAFDQNMRPFVAFVEDGQAKYYWYDSLVSDVAISDLSATARNPRACTDDKRETQTLSNDIILAYLDGTELSIRMQRDRYTVEYVLGNVTPDAALTRVGMHRENRLLFEVTTKIGGVPPPAVPETPPTPPSGPPVVPADSGNVLPNSGFDSDLTGWTPTGGDILGQWTQENGKLKFTSKRSTTQYDSIVSGVFYPSPYSSGMEITVYLEAVVTVDPGCSAIIQVVDDTEYGYIDRTATSNQTLSLSGPAFSNGNAAWLGIKTQNLNEVVTFDDIILKFLVGIPTLVDINRVTTNLDLNSGNINWVDNVNGDAALPSGGWSISSGTLTLVSPLSGYCIAINTVKTDKLDGIQRYQLNAKLDVTLDGSPLTVMLQVAVWELGVLQSTVTVAAKTFSSDTVDEWLVGIEAVYGDGLQVSFSVAVFCTDPSSSYSVNLTDIYMREVS